MTRRVVPALIAVALVCVGVVAMPGTASAAPGDYDPSFGTAGVATAPASGTLPTGANTLTIDTSGRIVTVGSTYDTATSQGVFTIHRFLPSGAIDGGFGTNGLAIVPITTGWSINQVAGVGVQPDGRIVFGARVYQSADANIARYGVLRLTSAGILDTSFDGGVPGDGILLLTVGPVGPPAGAEVERALSVDESGRILISGLTYYAGPPTEMRATMARLSQDGTYDPTFSGDGRFDLLLPTTDSDLKAFADLPGANGYALGGRTIPNVAPTTGQPTIVRISETGDLVTGFTSSLSNTPGRSTTYWQGDPTKLGEINALAGLPGGGLIAGGYQNTGRAALAKYTTDGALDPSFGVGGVTLLQVDGGSSAVNDLVLQPDGKILAAMYGSGASHGYVARFTAGGALDPTFGTGGVVETDPVGATDALALQGDGSIVAIAPRGQPVTTLVRLLGDPAPDPTPTDPTPTDPTPTTDPVGPPAIRVTAPGKVVKAKKLKALAGIASPAGAVDRVQIAVQRVDKRLLKGKQRCLWLANHRGVFQKVRAKQKKCSRPVYRPAAGTATWKYGLRKPFKKGKYVVYARVRLDDGRTATVRKPFRIR
jgi:uncharacterized delta-60 repeat protein